MTVIYTPKQLLARVRQLEAAPPISSQIMPPRCYANHQEHWIGWLREYDGPGYYGRGGHSISDASVVYNRVQNLGMIVWLAEAAGVHTGRVKQAHMTSTALGGRVAAQCGAARKLLPWAMVAKALWP